MADSPTVPHGPQGSSGDSQGSEEHTLPGSDSGFGSSEEDPHHELTPPATPRRIDTSGINFRMGSGGTQVLDNYIKHPLPPSTTPSLMLPSDLVKRLVRINTSATFGVCLQCY